MGGERFIAFSVFATAGLASAILGADLTSDELAGYHDLDVKPLQQFSNVELSDFLSLRNRLLSDNPNRPSPGQDVALFALKALRQPFRLNAVQFDLNESDCVSLVNRSIALALAADWQSYCRLTERLRHKDGMVTYRSRNFFTLGDWLPNNAAWLLRDITPELSGAEPFTHVVRPKVFEERSAAVGSSYTRTIFRGSDYSSTGSKETRSDTYIPREHIPEILPDLRTGDIALVIRGVGGNAGCDHMGIIIVDEYEGDVSIVHSAPKEVRQDPLIEFGTGYSWVSGFKFLRLPDDARYRARAETSKLESSVVVSAPQVVDQKVTALRAERSGK